MSGVSENNKRIVKNTFFLYIRMLMIMIVSLYTVRVVLQTLGEVDYGVHNVVGGVISMFTFITTTLSAASMRFFSYEIGRNDYERLRQYFSVTFWCYVILVIIVVILAETVGLWFVKNKLVIPPERMTAALWVYQCTVIGAIGGLLVVPYNSLILAKEKMNLYAYVGIAEAGLKLLVAFLLMTNIFSDKLILYAVLLLCTHTSVFLFYILYDLKHYKESHVYLFWDRKIFKDVLSYSSWSLLGSVSLVFRSQGINILINIFFGPVVNTARAIAYQVSTAVNTFVNSFTQALRPQQTKYYAAGEENTTLVLTYRATRICFFLILFLSLPILFETDFVLTLWLKDVPEYTVLFARLVIGVSIIEAIATPLKGLISSTGNIKYTQIINSLILISIFPISWVLFKMGLPAATTMIVSLVASISCHIVRIVYSCKLTNMQFKEYFAETMVPICKVTVLAVIPTFGAYSFLQESWLKFVVVTLVSVLSSGLSIWFLGMKNNEREILMDFVKNKLSRKG